MMDERTAERLTSIAATLDEIASLVERGRSSYDDDLAVARACQYNIIRLAADLDRMGGSWLAARPGIPWRLIKGMRNRIAHDYWTVDDDVVWMVVAERCPELRRVIEPDLGAARQIVHAEDR